MSTAVLDSSIVLIKPSKKLLDYVNKLKLSHDIPKDILNFKSKTANHEFTKRELLITKSDREFIKSLNLVTKTSSDGLENDVKLSENELNDNLLNLDDLHWIHAKIEEGNDKSKDKQYFHELFEGSDVLIPKNKEIPRNPELEKRCIKLKNQQDNRRYKAMTKNIDNIRIHYPEDTIAYQMKQINRHLIAVGQFIISVFAGFLFGFMGLELMVGTLDFGFRLLLGIMCGLIIALAELYFLAKKLNEDFDVEVTIDKDNEVNKIKQV